MKTVDDLRERWARDPRWTGIERPYTAQDVIRLRGSLAIEHTLARLGAERLWHLLQTARFVRSLGALTGNQAVQMVQAGLQAIYCSGWQVAGDMNTAHQTYPDQSLYPANAVPTLVARINNALRRMDQITYDMGRQERFPFWYVPIVADGEAGFGGILNAYELMKAMIEAGAAGVHFEDQLSSAKKCGHMGGKVLVPTAEAVHKLVAARLAADVCGVPTLIVARTDANAATLLTSDVDPRDQPFCTGRRTSEGYFEVRAGLEQAIARARAYAPYADMLWCETARPDLDEARRFAEGVHAAFPGKLLAYNCSPSFNWGHHLPEDRLASFQDELAAIGYRFQFITLAGWHAVNLTMFELAHAYRDQGMLAYARLQQREFELERDHGYRAVKHQSFVGAGYFDDIAQAVMGGSSSIAAMKGSTEEEQFRHPTPDFTEAEAHHREGRPLRPVPPPRELVPDR
jgi:isocitrate lyase